MSKSPFDPTTAVLGLYSYAEFAALVGVFLPLMRRAYYALVTQVDYALGPARNSRPVSFADIPPGDRA